MRNSKSNKNIVKNSTIQASGNIQIGDQSLSNYHIANVPFTLTDIHQFLTKIDTNLLAHTIPSFSSYQRVIDEFFQNPLKKILIITGQNESGKTHLLRNLILEANLKLWKTFYINPPMADLPPQGLSKNEPILIFRDDIDWDESDFLLPILQFLETRSNIKLVLTVHQSWKDRVVRSIGQIKDLPGKVDYIELGAWTHNQLIEILHLAANSLEVKHEQDIVRQFANPYLLKYFGESIAGNPKIGVEAISRTFAQKARRIFEQSLQPELHASKVPSFIAHLVFNRAHDHLLTDFAAKMELEVDVLQTILQRLKSTGILRSKYGRHFIIPEVKGDFYMAGELDMASNLSELLDGFMHIDAKSAAHKIIEIAQFTTSETRERIADYLNSYLISCDRKIQEKPELLHRAHIGLAKEALSMEIQYGISHATDAAFSLVTFALLHQTKSIETEFFNDNVLTVPFTNKPQGDEYGRFLEIAVHILPKRADYLSLLQICWLLGYKAHAHNYQPATLLSAAFRPANNNKESYQTGLQYARHWLLDSDNLRLRNMAVHALQVMLGAFFEHISSEYNTITFGRDVLSDHADLFELRAEAISLVAESLKNEVACLDGLKILDNIGEGEHFHSHNDLLKLSAFPKIQQEVERCIPLIGEILCTNSDFLIQKTTESTLLKWWLWGISTSMEPYLLQFERTSEYLLYRFMIDDAYMTEDFARLKFEAPVDDRREWYWKHSDLKEKRKLSSIDQYKELAQQLSMKYSTPAQIAQFVHDSAEKIAIWLKQDERDIDFPLRKLSQVVQSWSVVETNKFKVLLADKTLSQLLPEWIRTDVQTQLLSSGNYLPEEIAVPLLARIPDLNMAEMSQLVFLIQKQQPAEKEVWLKRMISEGQEPMLHDIASRLCFIFSQEDEVSKIAEMLLQILESGKIINENFFDWSASHAYGYLFKHRHSLSPDLYEHLRKVTFDWVKKMNKLDSHEADVIRYCIRTTEHLMDLFDYRAEHFTIENSLDKTEFQVKEVLLEDIIPREELVVLFQTSENHRRFVDKIHVWEKAALVYTPDWKNDYLNVQDPNTKESWIVQHLQSALEQNDTDALRLYCSYIPRDEKYIPLMLKAWSKLLPTNTDDEMCSILYHWATYSGRSGGFYHIDYNRYDPPKVFWGLVIQQPIFDARLKMLVQRIERELEEMWKKNKEDN